MSQAIQRIDYVFQLADGTQRRFTVRLRQPDLAFVPPTPAPPPPDWARLDFHQCANCPLNPDDTPHCPAAVSLATVIAGCQDLLSHADAEVVVQTANRTIFHESKMAAAVGSLIGLHMATSGCPILDYFRPMALTHLPFATRQETLVRAVSTHLLAQYFIQRAGGQPDWSLGQLVKIYEAINVVNAHFTHRLRAVCARDASLNAVVGLDCFATMTVMSIEADGMAELAPLFRAYLPD